MFANNTQGTCTKLLSHLYNHYAYEKVLSFSCREYNNTTLNVLAIATKVYKVPLATKLF